MVLSQEKKQEDDTDSHVERRLYRQGSHGSSLHIGEGGMVLGSVNGSAAGVGGGNSRTNISIRSRTPSGKSIRSRTATRAEYHEDLKKELKQGFTCHLLFLSFIIMMGNSFIFGYNIGVLNQPVALIRQFYNTTYTNRQTPVLVETDGSSAVQSNTTSNSSSVSYVETKAGVDEYMIVFLWSLTTTLFVIGGMIGAYAAGYLADRVGRKKACLINCIPCFVGAIVSTISVSASSPELLMLGRFITGLNCGVATQLAPMYLLEIAPYNLKGAFGTANQLFITIGIFVGSVWGLREILGTEAGWPYLLLLNCVPSFICLVCLPFLPDSPRYLMLSKKDRDGAEKALQYIRQQLDVTADLEEMETELSDDKGDQNADESYSMLRLLKTKDLRMPLFVAIFLQVIQQLSGINAIFFYSTGIYANAGVPLYAIQYAVLVTNAINVIMTIVAVPIMDKAGRRPLLLYPMIVMVVILALITVALSLQAKLLWMSYISIACVVGYVICFAIGLGPIPMMITAELFRQGPRPRAMSLAGLVNWFCTAVVAISFEMIQAVTKEYTFIIFLVLMIGFTAFVFFKVPETKNKTFEEIASVFQPGGDIEVEEVVDYPIYTGTDQMDGETDFTVGADKSNGYVPVNTTKDDDVFVKIVDEEKQALRSATEDA